MTDAPLKENLASALLYTVGWHEQKSGGKFDSLIDPMWLGTLLIEALLMFRDYPVGLDNRASQFDLRSGDTMITR